MARIFAAFLVIAACATAPKPPPVSKATVFDMHSSLWLNLHLTLYRDAIRIKLGRGEPDTKAFTAEERATWDTAVATYGKDAIDKDLLFDDQMVAFGLDLVRLETAPALSALQGPLPRALEAALPVYRAHRWPVDDAQNHAYIAEMSPRVEALAAAVVPDLVRAYGKPWPTGPIRVDLSDYAGRVGAYTTVEPVHIIMTSSEPRSLEIPFHEASHGLVGPIQDALDRELKARGKTSRDLWHALLFYTTGEIVRRHVPGHVPYAEEHGLWTRGEWPACKRALDQAWKPYLDGKTDRDSAIRALADAF